MSWLRATCLCIHLQYGMRMEVSITNPQQREHTTQILASVTGSVLRLQATHNIHVQSDGNLLKKLYSIALSSWNLFTFTKKL